MARVLVTGVGAIIGYGIVRSLKPHGHYVVGMDVYNDAVGQHWCDAFVQAKFTNDPGYAALLASVLEAHKPELVIPGIEQDVDAYDGLRSFFSGRGVEVCLNHSELIQLGSDKWLMHQAQIERGIAPIPTSMDRDFDTLSREFGLPFLLKPRRSYAGRGIVRIGDKSDFLPHRERIGKELMAQKLLGRDEEEYTVSVFGDGDGGCPAAIQLRRTLSREGATQKAWRIDDLNLDRQVRRIVSAFRPLGPTNLQFRKEGDTFYLLEINPRIASAASLRTAFGFNDAQMAVEYFLRGRLPVQPALKSGFAIRYIEDLVFYDRDRF